jgi:anti-sigma factor RsiW
MTQLSTEDQSLIAGYVLGDLEPEEMAQVERRMAEDAELLAEINAMQVSLWVMPQGMPMMTPPPGLRDRILTTNESVNALVGTPERAISGIQPGMPAGTPLGTSERMLERTVERTPERTTAGTTEPVLRSPSFPWVKILAGLALLSALLLGVDNFRLRNALSVAQRAETDRVAAILQRPNSRLVALKGAQGDAAGTLLFTPGKWQEVVVSLGNLPPLPPDQIYRMWLTLANGTTIPCGEFNTDAKGSVFVKLNPPETPPKGVKATGIYVTVDGANEPLNPAGDRVLSGSI